MQYESYDLSNYKMFNPVNGDLIIDGEDFDDPASLIAYWVDEVFEEPSFYNEPFRKDWEAFCMRYGEENEGDTPGFEALEKFLVGYENPDWKVIEITSSGLACGPVSNTVWYVVHKDTVVDELDDDEYCECEACGEVEEDSLEAEGDTLIVDKDVIDLLKSNEKKS